MKIKKHELVGLEVEVKNSTHKGYIGMKGVVVDETKNTFIVEIEGKEKMIPKKGTRFKFDVKGVVEVEGKDILYRPEDRIKKAR